MIKKCFLSTKSWSCLCFDSQYINNIYKHWVYDRWNCQESATKRIGIIGELQFQLEVEIEEAKEALELFILGLPVTEQQVADIQAKIQCKLTILDLYQQDVEKIKTHTKEKYR